MGLGPTGLKGPSWALLWPYPQKKSQAANTLIFTIDVINAFELTIRGFFGSGRRRRRRRSELKL